MNQKFKALFFLLLLISAVDLAFGPLRSRISKELGLLVDVISIIQTHYVEEVPIKKLVSGALAGMLRSLDPYSQFLDEKSYADLLIGTEGHFGGIGIEVSTKGGSLHVITPLDGTPAERAGLKPGDMVLKIDDVLTKDMALDAAVKKMRGDPGTSVKLTIMREKESQLIEFSVPRDIIKIKSIKGARLLENNAGYIRISAFQENTAEDLEKALTDLESLGMKGLILDVRNNSGGVFDSAVEVAEKFVPKGRLIVSTRGRESSHERQLISDPKRPHSVKPLVILVNKGSASGSEILAGAIQDHKLGTLVGTKTFGKGSVQTLVPLPDKTALRLTTSRYYTPSGRLIHEIGITPDVIVEAPDDKNLKDAQMDRALQIIQNG